ncbi:MAG: hypothetical protein ACLU7D_08105 [Collinsella sp.]
MHIEAAPADVAKIAALGGATVDGEGKTPLPAAIESALRELGCGPHLPRGHPLHPRQHEPVGYAVLQTA